MPTAKRASMREGPLAALFRKTADDTGPAEPEAPATGEIPAAEAAADRRQLPHPAFQAPPAPPGAGAADPLAAGAPAPRVLLRHPGERPRATGPGAGARGARA